MRLLRLIGLGVLIASACAAQPSADTAAAIALYRERKNPEARAAFEQLFSANPKNAEAAHFLGLIALREKREDDAVRFHETATALAPGNSGYFIALGDAYGRKAASASLLSKLTWAKKCRASLEKAVALEPASFAAHAGLVEFYRRAPGVAGGGLPKAYAQAESFKKIDPVGGTQLLASLYRQESRHAEIFALLDEQLKAFPDHYVLHATYGRSAAESGQHLEQGIQSLERCLTLAPSARAPSHASVWFYLGEIRLKQNALAAARAAYESALKLEPNHREASAALKKLFDASPTPAP
jgi:cytochrome c-type biogenesis protein CcmH/NrfG